jgi:hypothetical protein
MISEGGTNLLLPARDAARRFVSCRVKVKRREIGWCPLVLRWRKRGKHLPSVIVHRGASSAKFLSLSHFHFHFANYQTHRSTTNILRIPGSSTRLFDTRIIRDDVRASVRKTRPSPDRFNYQSRRAIESAPQLSAMRRHFGHAFPSASTSRAAYSVAPQVSAPRESLFSRPAVSFVRPISAKDNLLIPQSRIVHYWSPLLLTRPRKNIDSGSPRALERQALLPQYQRTEELVWRRVSKTTTELTERVQHLESIVTPDGPSSHVAPNQQPAVDIARAIEAVKEMPVTKLDPALVDSLANDVIRRVEQRVRIERERRGL